LWYQKGKKRGTFQLAHSERDGETIARREIAIRITIGANPREITRVFVREGCIVVAAGLALGIVAALATGRLLGSQLFGVRPSDSLALAAAVAALGAAAMFAVGWPSRRAATTDPVIALRIE
jgi:putative ABC transport system permease protein